MRLIIAERFQHKVNNPLPWAAHPLRAPIVPLIVALLYVALSVSLAANKLAYSYEQKSFLWKVQSSRSTVYLLGSIHFLKEDVYPLNQTIEKVYESADKLVVEADINDLGNLDLKMLADRAFYKNDDHVEKHVSAETYRLIQNESKTLGMPIELLRMQKPWFLALSFQAMELLRLGYSPQHGVDYHFLTKAQGKKRILELESLEEQLNLLSGFSDREQEQFLIYTLETLSSLDRQVENMVRAWKSGNAQAMESALAAALPPDASLEPIVRKLFDERNLKMTSKIEGYLNVGGSYFVIVGAGHLIGKKGIVELLKNKGYTIEQL
ncbi:MAG: TraB/GumN family protein [Deltaproteobacteria bacterium]